MHSFWYLPNHVDIAQRLEESVVRSGLTRDKREPLVLREGKSTN